MTQEMSFQALAHRKILHHVFVFSIAVKTRQ